MTLTTDPTQDTFDRFGRLLAYVTRRGDGKDLGEVQLRAGWAEVYVFRDPFRLLERFRKGERAAREARRGVWGECDGDFHRASVASSPPPQPCYKARHSAGVAIACRSNARRAAPGEPA